MTFLAKGVEFDNGSTDNSDAKRTRVVGPMWGAGFPPCTKSETPLKNQNCFGSARTLQN